MDTKTTITAAIALAIGAVAAGAYTYKDFADTAKWIDAERAAQAEADRIEATDALKCRVQSVEDGSGRLFEQAVCGDMALSKEQSEAVVRNRKADGSVLVSRDQAREIDLDFDAAAKSGAMAEPVVDVKPAELGGKEVIEKP